ncbi:hypothetical protein Pars_0365 [Pyrobaculum arsenaticum DSM 13514]|uniref:Uncharacterized protein n=2 Tax=Pyrobaculum arsenaticum TaxID=121277 RepID=A4WHV3_PYRAR|nr:hypothetical protein Pars_0365 [Pyrobaculum arsenaticum DSM 13514]
MSVVDQAMNCLAQFDKNHKEFYEKNRDRIKTFIEKLGAVSDFICTEEKKFAGLKPRTDLYIRTEKRHVLIEAKLCVSSGATVGRSLIQKIVSTIAKILQTRPEAPDDFYVFVIIPREAVPTALEKIRRGILNEVNAVLRETGSPRELKWVMTLDMEIPHFSLNTPLRLDVEGRVVTVKILIAPI